MADPHFARGRAKKMDSSIKHQGGKTDLKVGAAGDRVSAMKGARVPDSVEVHLLPPVAVGKRCAMGIFSVWALTVS